MARHLLLRVVLLLSCEQVFKIGFINGLVALALWAGLGMPIWKLLGWY